MSVSPFAPPSQPSPADLARQRHNDRRDDKRKAGTQALRAVQGGTPAPGSAPIPGGKPPPPSAAAAPSPIDQPPQLQAPAAPVPQETSPAFTPATYKPPNKGLEYLSAGLSILFPGSPISKLATGFAGGLNQGAQQRYQRNEQTAEQQYGAAKDAAQTSFANQQQTFQAAQAKAQADFENAKTRYQERAATRARGIDPSTGQPIPLPAVQSLLPKGQPPSAQGYANAYRSLATMAMQRGATDVAQQYATQAEDYNRQAIDDANNARALSVAMSNQTAQDRREIYRENSADQRQQNSEAAMDRREATREAHEDARSLRSDSTRFAQIKQEALRTSGEFYAAWKKAITPVAQKDALGNPKVDPTTGQPIMTPAISPQAAPVLGKMFSSLDRDSDPTTTAQWYAEHTADPTQKELLLARGRAADLNRRSQGLPVIPHGYPKAEPAKPASDPIKAAGFDPSDPRVKAWIARAKSLGVDPSTPEAIATMKTDLGTGSAASGEPAPAENLDVGAPAI